MILDAMEIDSYYFPVNLSLFKNLEGKMLTHIEAMNLPPGAEKANKDLIRQSLWQWFDSVQENSLTSWKGCIGPLFYKGKSLTGTDGTYLWFTDIGETRPVSQANLKIKSGKSENK